MSEFGLDNLGQFEKVAFDLQAFFPKETMILNRRKVQIVTAKKIGQADSWSGVEMLT